MNIRTATLNDLDAVTAVEAACFPAAEAASKKEFAERLRYYGNHFWLMLDGEKLIGFVDDTHDVALATSQGRTGHHDNGGLGVVQGLQVGAQAARGHGRVKLGLDEDAPTHEVQASRETQRRAHFGSDLGRRRNDGARQLVLHIRCQGHGFSRYVMRVSAGNRF